MHAVAPSLPLVFDPPDPPNAGILFVDHAQTGRSGHLGHALVEAGPGRILAFYPNCSDAPALNTQGPEWSGHNGDGWMEFKRSGDGGRTWEGPFVLDYSKRVHAAGRGRSVMCEKALMTGDGAILLFNLECDIATDMNWAPLWEPTCMRSTDEGHTWSEPRQVSAARGRIFDAIRLGPDIVALQRERVYALLVSTDHGRHFTRRSELPLAAAQHCYGTLLAKPDGSLTAYVYNPADEQHLDMVTSRDGGVTWEAPRQAYFEKKIRNPQVASLGDGFVLHGRSGSGGLEAGHLVFYTSRDGMAWDAGRYLRMQEAGAGAYSNNLLVTGPDTGAPPRLLIQASHAYRQSRTNILHWWVSVPSV